MKIRVKLLGILGIISAFSDAGETEVDFVGNTVGERVNHLLARMKSEWHLKDRDFKVNQL